MRKLWRNIKAFCIKYRRSLRLQRWSVTDNGTDKIDRIKQGLEKTLFRSK